MKLRFYQIVEKAHFLDYLKTGLLIKVRAAIDFSTQLPIFQNKLASWRKDKLDRFNYMKVLQTVSKILLDYDDDQFVPLYGIGGIPLTSDKLEQFFPLSFDEI